MAERLGFIGVGKMGNPMARNLLKRGRSLLVYDAVPAAAENLRELGATLCTSAAEVAAGTDLVITMLPSSPHVEAVVAGDGGLARALPTGATVIDMSTISPTATRRLSAALAERGVRMLDAPVVGGPQACEDGTLTIMVGGERDDFEVFMPLFESLGKNIFYVGASGSGQVIKLIGNLTGAVLTVASLEALLIGKALGVLESDMAEVMKLTVGGWFWERTIPNKVLKRDFQPGFALRLMHKDLGLAMEAAASVGVPATLGAQVQQLYTAAMTRGMGEQEWTAVLQLLEDNAGVTLAEQ